MENNTEEIKKVIEDLLKKMGVVYEDVMFLKESKLGRSSFVIKSKESGLLIGSEGANFQAINHLIRKILSKRYQNNDSLDFFIDVNDYQEKMVENLKNKAFILAERARSFKTKVEMDPMSSYERRIIHTFFENTPDVKTESVGEGANRRIVLRYIEEEKRGGL